MREKNGPVSKIKKKIFYSKICILGSVQIFKNIFFSDLSLKRLLFQFEYQRYICEDRWRPHFIAFLTSKTPPPPNSHRLIVFERVKSNIL